eukprot:scaffold125399_cov60-Phaeocystis_antarctica.AAC.1
MCAPPTPRYSLRLPALSAAALACRFWLRASRGDAARRRGASRKARLRPSALPHGQLSRLSPTLRQRPLP